MSLAARDARLTELMDDPACDPELLRATLRRFATINRLVSGWGIVYRTRLSPHLRTLDRPARVLDLGSGGGDLVARLAAAARRDGLTVAWTGIDPDPHAHAVALERGSLPGVTYRQADASTLVSEGAVFDAVLSNHVLHHLGDGLPEFLPASRTLSRGIVLHGDIARSRLAYALYAIGITPFAPGTFLRTDGLRSIRRSYTASELAAVLSGETPRATKVAGSESAAMLDETAPGAWSVTTPAPFRVLAVGRGRA